MKAIKIVLVLAITFISYGATMAQGHDHSGHKMDKSKEQMQEKSTYACSMHADVTSDKPGKCSKCGMNLTKQEMVKTYTCSMHPDVTSDKEGNCPKCGMKLTEKKMDMGKTYVCSMHADVKSDKPGSCTKCGMKLTEVKK